MTSLTFRSFLQWLTSPPFILSIRLCDLETMTCNNENRVGTSPIGQGYPPSITAGNDIDKLHSAAVECHGIMPAMCSGGHEWCLVFWVVEFPFWVLRGERNSHCAFVLETQTTTSIPSSLQESVPTRNRNRQWGFPPCMLLPGCSLPSLHATVVW